MADNNTLKNRAANQHARSSVETFVKYVDDDVAFIENIDNVPEVSGRKVPGNILCFCHSGRIEFEIGGTQYVLNKGETLVCPSGIPITIASVSDDIKYTILFMKDRIIQTLLNSNVDIWNHAVYVKGERVVTSSNIENLRLQKRMGWHFSEILHLILDEKENPFRKEMLYLMLQMMLLGFCARYKETEQRKAETISVAPRSPQSKVIFTKFMEILHNEPVKHQPVYYYAEKLFISSKYLSHVCKEVSGKSANEFIQSAVVGEIIDYLKNTSLSVKEISNRMGFSNISFFGKFVKAHLGMSPNNYRKQMYKEGNEQPKKE